MQRRNEIIVLLPVFIIQQGFLAYALLYHLLRNLNGIPLFSSVEHYHLQCIQRHSGIAVGKRCNHLQPFLFHFYALRAKPLFIR